MPDGTELLDLPIDTLAIIFSHTNQPVDGYHLRLACKIMREPVHAACIIACANRLGCRAVSSVLEVLGADPSDDPLRTASFVMRSHAISKQHAAASNHTIYVSADSSEVLCCGANDAGQLGNGKVSQFASTILVPSTPHAAVYAARQQQMVEGFDAATPAPARLAVATGASITCLAAGRSHSLAALSDGRVCAWGLAKACAIECAAGVLNVPVPGIINLTASALDDEEGMATLATDPAHTSGTTESSASAAANEDALLTDALSGMWFTPESGPIAPAVASPMPVVQVAAGQQHSIFLLRDGRVFCSGVGTSGELGDGQQTDSTRPVRAQLPEPAMSIAAGGFHSLAIGCRPARTVYGWGSAASKQLGIYTVSQRRAHPIVGYGLSTPSALATSLDDLPPTSPAVTKAAEMVVEIAATAVDETPISAMCLPPCAALAAGMHHSLFVTQHGLVISAGKNGSGQLGTPRFCVSQAPTLIEALAHVRIVSLAAGQSHSAFVDEFGRLYTCGRAANGRLGCAPEGPGDPVPLVRTPADNTLTSPPFAGGLARKLPEQVHFPLAMPAGNAVRVHSVACGTDHTVAVTRDGRVFTFGRGQAGQLGSRSRKDRLGPEEVLLDEVEAPAAFVM